MKVKVKEEDRPNSQTSVSGVGFSHTCLLLRLGGNSTEESRPKRLSYLQ